MWWSKANFFTLVSEAVRDEQLIGLGVYLVRERLETFSKSVPEDYALAAREAVGRKRERELRAAAVRTILGLG